MKRTKEITIIHYRRRRTKTSRTTTAEGCPATETSPDRISEVVDAALSALDPGSTQEPLVVKQSATADSTQVKPRGRRASTGAAKL
jgi:hypothetical protein